ncbi:MAG: hypothetical protein GWO24_35310, partial [Akkermansiaceae bacterium]|nr:hypothetical protein [Akkermansiaceae bacterium]
KANGDRPWGFLIALPVYEPGATLATVADRRDNLLGFAIGVFRVRDIVGTVSAKPSSEHLELVVKDQTDSDLDDKEKVLFEAGGDQPLAG